MTCGGKRELDLKLEVSGPYLSETTIDADPDMSVPRAGLDGVGTVIDDPIPTFGRSDG